MKRLIATRNFFKRVKSYISCTNLNVEELLEIPSYPSSEQDEFILEILSDNYLWFPIKEFLSQSIKNRIAGYLSSLLSTYLISVMDGMDVNLTHEVQNRYSSNSTLVNVNEIAKYVRHVNNVYN